MRYINRSEAFSMNLIFFPFVSVNFFCFCRSQEIKFNALQILSQYVTSDECRELTVEQPQMIPFLLQNYKEALQQPDFRTVKYNTRYGAEQFQEVLCAFSAASDSVCSEVVRLGGLCELAAALQMDPNGILEGLYLYFYVLNSSFTVWHILLAGHTGEIRKDPDIPNGTPLFLLSYIL